MYTMDFMADNRNNRKQYKINSPYLAVIFDINQAEYDKK